MNHRQDGATIKAPREEVHPPPLPPLTLPALLSLFLLMFFSRLLRKVNLHTYKSDQNHREQTIRARYYLQDALDYRRYNALCGSLRQLAHRLAALDPEDAYRTRVESELLEKLWAMGILKRSREQGAGLSSVEHDVTVSALCRRRLGVVMARSGMVDSVKTVISPFFFFRFLLQTIKS